MAVLIADGLDCTEHGKYTPAGMTLAEMFPDAAKSEAAEKEERALGREVPDAYLPAPFTLSVLVDGATASALTANIDALVDAWRPGKSFQLQGDTDAEVLSCTVLTSHVDKVIKHNDATPSATVLIAGTRDPNWALPVRYAIDEHGDPVDGADHSGTGGHNYSALDVPGDVRVRGSVGDTFSRVRVKWWGAQASEMFAVAVKENPPADYQPWQDYAGTADGTANGDAAASLAMTQNADYATIGTPATLGNDYRDPSGNLCLARVRTTATANTRYRALTSVTGSGIAVSSTRAHDSVSTSQPNDGYEVANLGVVNFPEVPGITTGSGFGTETKAVYDETAPNTYTNPVEYTLTRGSVAVPALKVTALGVKASAADVYSISLLNGAGEVVAQVGRLGSGFADVAGGWCEGVVRSGILGPIGVFVPAGTCSIRVTMLDGGTIGYDSPNTDFAFRIHGAAPLGFNSSLAIQSKTTESGKSALVDLAWYPPAFLATQVFGAFGAGQGAVIDKTAANPALHRAYIAASTAGTAGPAVNTTRYGYGLWMPPGDSDWSFMADTPKNAPPSTFGVVIEYQPCRITRG